MKKKIIGLAFTIAVVSALSTAAYASTYVNNEDVTSSVFTSSSNGYTLFPVRYLGEKLGCDVYWNPDDKCITEIFITEVRLCMIGRETVITL